MRQIKRNFKTESIIRLILAVIGIISFSFSPRFAWGFIVSGIISKETIDLTTKEGWYLLSLIVGVMILVLYFLLDTMAIVGFIVSTISYFVLRKIFNNYQNQ